MSEHFKIDSDDDVQMPLGIGAENNAESQEITLGAEHRPRANVATLVLIGLIGAGLAGIYGLSMFSKPRAASAAQTDRDARVDSAIADLLAKSGGADKVKGLFRDTDKLVAMFYKYPGGTGRGEALATNPFVLEAPAGPSMDPIIQSVNSSGAEQERMRRVADTFATLHLESVMLSRTMSAAMINKKIYTVGAKVADFTVLAIEQDHVVLGYGSTKFELKVHRQGLDAPANP
jgi:hypothetical protein